MSLCPLIHNNKQGINSANHLASIMNIGNQFNQTKFRRNTGRRKRRTANICSMKAGGRNLKIKPTRANSWQRPGFLDRAWLTGYLVLWRSLLDFLPVCNSTCFSSTFYTNYYAISLRVARVNACRRLV